MITIKQDLILTEDTSFAESITVNGNIIGNYNLKVMGNIDARDINARDINAWNIDARDINAEKIDARDINARDINAWNIDANDIDAWNIDARDINANDIDAWDINARDINARDISFYAFVISRKSLICKSIKGRRENNIAKCLDAEIEIIEDVKICDKCGQIIKQ